MKQLLTRLFCRHIIQYPSRIGSQPYWQCSKCSRHTDPIAYEWLRG